MLARTAAFAVLTIGASLVARPAGASHGEHGGGHHHRGCVISPGLLGVGGGYGAYLPPPIVFVPVVPVVAPPPIIDRGGLLAGPMPAAQRRGLSLPAPASQAKRADPARSAHLVTLGDRLFRAGNTRRAEDRYEQATRSDPNSAAPHVRLAQLALVRGQYAAAASQIREAQTAEPGWLIRAPDVQSLFAEPTDFARHIAKLESHLQANPDDRDAWLLLGAEWFLSGRTHKAADVFVRLSDRKPDAALGAFLDASTPPRAERDQ